MASDVTNTDQIKRINDYLACKHASLDTVTKGVAQRLIKTDDAIQARLTRVAQAKETLRTSGISVSTIAADTGISNKTFYSNELLGGYLNQFVTEKEKTASSADLDAAKERIVELEDQVGKMLYHDIDSGKLWHENESLHNDLKLANTHIKNLERQLEEARLTIQQMNAGKVVAGNFTGRLVKTDAPVAPPAKRVGSDPDTYNLGISYGRTDDFLGALKVAADCGTHTVMLYCDNEYFETPTAKAVKGFNIVIHGPVDINLASDEPRIRNTSIRRMKAIIKKCNSFAGYITAFVIHPGSADNNRLLIDSLKELLQEAKFPLALETMAGKGRELCSTLEEMHDLCEQFKDYENFTVCIDTCHMSDAGYKIADGNAFIDEVTKQIPLSKISCIHLNDSKNHSGSRKDRHAQIGKGCIPVSGLQKITTYEYFYDIPKIIETPQDYETGALTFPSEMKLLLQNQ